jgi:UDP-2,4-diacetamido-2,4,6-trideoxy-beta-L-altropyranose hydrolase
MAIALRADASDAIGNGHVMRCVTLANTLAERGERCHFICRSLTEPAKVAILNSGHQLHALPDARGKNDRLMSHAEWLSAAWQIDAAETKSIVIAQGCDWLVIDHYGIDAAWEQCLRHDGLKLAVIDDLADRHHDCDLLLDQNLHADPHLRYAGLVPDRAQKLLGPRYALLRKEFGTGARAKLEGTNVLVAFSGADSLHLTVMTLQALDGHRDVTVVANSQNADLETIQKICAVAGWSLHIDTNSMATFMQQAAIAIGAGGGMVWERAAFGLPSIAVIVAGNQRQQVLNAEAAGMVLALDGMTLTVPTLAVSLDQMLGNPELRKAMSDNCRRIVDGKGRLRVVERLLPSDVTLRLATDADSKTIWGWRDDPLIRRVSRDGSPIAWDSHQRWFSKVLQNPLQDLLLANDGIGPLGVVRFDRDDEGAEVSIYLAPQRLGQGRGAALLLAAETWLANIVQQPLTVRADVLAGNAASEELFRSCGYVIAHGMFRKTVGKIK